MRFFDCCPSCETMRKAAIAGLSLMAVTYMAGNTVLNFQDNPTVDSYKTLDSVAYCANFFAFLGYLFMNEIREYRLARAEERLPLIEDHVNNLLP